MQTFSKITLTIFTCALIFVNCADKPKERFRNRAGDNKGNGTVTTLAEEDVTLEAAQDVAFAMSLARYTLRNSPFRDNGCTPKEAPAQPSCIMKRVTEKRAEYRYHCNNKMKGTQTYELHVNPQGEKRLVVNADGLQTWNKGKMVGRNQKLSVVLTADKCEWSQEMTVGNRQIVIEGGAFDAKDPLKKTAKAAAVDVKLGPALSADDSAATFISDELAVDEEAPAASPEGTARPQPRATQKPKPKQAPMSEIMFEIPELTWDGNCAHPPTGRMTYQYIKDGAETPVTGELQLTKAEAVYPSDKPEKTKKLKWPSSCPATTTPGDIPLSIENF
ncbi:MAG TPA: hypothetical protein VFV50_00705 [Bdellovibrionales bacterium]|nr:hypothetical protein [Bdellovibrionales bacterium]